MIDLNKGVAIFCVLWGHVIQYSYNDEYFFENIIFRFIYGFHMPLFMIISGYLFFATCQKYDLKEVIIKQLKSIAYPMMIWNAIIGLIYIFIDYSDMTVRDAFVELLYEEKNGLWFLWSVLVCSIGTVIVYKISRSILEEILGYLLVFAIIIFIPGKIEPCKTMNIYMFPYYIIGFNLRRNKRMLSKLKRVKYIAIILYPILLSFFHTNEYIYVTGINPFGSALGFGNQIIVDIYRWVLGLTGVAFAFSVNEMVINIKNSEKIVDLISILGRSTLQIYVLQSVLIECNKSYFNNIGLALTMIDINIFNFILTPCLSFAIAMLLYFIIKVIKHYPALNKLLFGR